MKVKAFTIVEMMIALAISAVVITITYYAITSVTKTLNFRQSQIVETEALHELRFLLHYDFDQNQSWETNEQASLVELDQQLRYDFSSTTIKRMQGEREQAFIFDKVEQTLFYFKNTNLPSRLKLRLSRGGQRYLFNFPLNNDAATQLKHINQN